VTENESSELVANDYPTEFESGASKSVVLGVDNNEYEAANYSIVVVEQDVETANNETIIREQRELERFETRLGHDETWLHEHDLEPTITGEEVQNRLAPLRRRQGSGRAINRERGLSRSPTGLRRRRQFRRRGIEFTLHFYLPSLSAFAISPSNNVVRQSVRRGRSRYGILRRRIRCLPHRCPSIDGSSTRRVTEGTTDRPFNPRMTVSGRTLALGPKYSDRNRPRSLEAC